MLVYSDTLQGLIKSISFLRWKLKTSLTTWKKYWRSQTIFTSQNFQTDHKFYGRSNEEVFLNYKNELEGTQIQEFRALKPELYYNLVANGQKQMSAKRNHQKIRPSQIEPWDVQKKVETGDLVRVENIKFNIDKHHLQSVFASKNALSEYDDKSYISSDRETTLPFGEFSLKDE